MTESENKQHTQGTYANRYKTLKHYIFDALKNGMTATDLKNEINQMFQTAYTRNTVSEALNSLYRQGKICKGRDKVRKKRGRPKVRWYFHPHYGHGQEET